MSAATVIYLIRHGQAEAGWDIQHDPGLNETGRQQAYTAARALSDRGPLPIIVSPLRRTRETAHEFELMWGGSAKVDSRVAEIPSTGMTLTERGEWLNALTQRRWDELDEIILSWRRAAIQCLLDISQDTVVVSHFMIVNAVVSWARGDQRVACCKPLPGSCTILERAGDSLRVVKVGAEGASIVR
jgi:broad specificity phosphatase PhoE